MSQNVRVRYLLLAWSAAIIAALVACGGSAAPATQPPLPPPTATALSAIGSVDAPNGPPGQNCGTIRARGSDTVSGLSAQQSADCFWRAYQHCAMTGTAVLTVETEASPATEIATTRAFAVRGSGGVCTIQETVTSQVFAPPPNPLRTTTYTCAGLARDPDGTLRFQACGKEGEIVVAPKP